MLCGLVFGRFPVSIFDRLSSIAHDVKLNLLPSERIETFWDVPRLGIQPFLCFMLELSVFDCRRCKLNLLPNERVESFYDALWFCIRPFS